MAVEMDRRLTAVDNRLDKFDTRMQADHDLNVEHKTILRSVEAQISKIPIMITEANTKIEQRLSLVESRVVIVEKWVDGFQIRWKTIIGIVVFLSSVVSFFLGILLKFFHI